MKLETEKVEAKWKILLVDCENSQVNFDAATESEFLIRRRVIGTRDIYQANVIIVAKDSSNQVHTQFHILKNRFGEAEHYLGFEHAKEACAAAINWSENRAEANDENLVKRYKELI